MHWTDLITMLLLTFILCLVIQDNSALMAACFVLGIVGGVYRGLRPYKKEQK